jgi:glycosyltransferase involved in cell wall biosynthesis
VKSTELNTDIFVFTPEEVEKIRSYTKDAKKHIEQMFNEIARLSENSHKECLKIGILITDLAGGGAERVVLTLADSFKMAGIETKIIILEDIIKHDIEDTIVLSLSDPRQDLKIISYLGFNNVYTKLIKFKKRLAKKMKKSYLKKKAKKLQLLQKKENFDFFISHLPLADEVIKLTDLKRVFVIHTDYRSELELLRQKQPFRAIRREKKYKSVYRGEKLVAISKGVAEGIKSFIDCAEIKIIYNPFIQKVIMRKAQEDPIPYSFDYILHPARFYPIKRHDILFQSIKYMKNNLKIVLLTNKTEALDNLIQKYQVEDRVIVAGFHQNPYPYFLNAKLTVLSSEREGLPTVLVESLILHTPIVSTNCPSGPQEIMRDDLSAYLANVNDPKDLAQKIDLALKDYPEIGSRYYDMFDSQKIVQEYLNYMAN